MAKSRKGNTAGKPNDDIKSELISVRVSKEFCEELNKVAASRKVSATTAFRHLAEKGLQTVAEGTFDSRLTDILGAMKRSTKRNEQLSKLLVEMTHNLEIKGSAAWHLTLGIANETGPPDINAMIIKAQNESKETFRKQMNKVIKGEDRLSARIRNDMTEEDLK